MEAWGLPAHNTTYTGAIEPECGSSHSGSGCITTGEACYPHDWANMIKNMQKPARTLHLHPSCSAGRHTPFLVCAMMLLPNHNSFAAPLVLRHAWGTQHSGRALMGQQHHCHSSQQLQAGTQELCRSPSSRRMQAQQRQHLPQLLHPSLCVRGRGPQGMQQVAAAPGPAQDGTRPASVAAS